MKTHGVAKHSKFIPTVVPFEANEKKKYVVIDVADIVTVVGLLKTKKSSKTFFVISPSTAFDSNMESTAGKLSNLC